MESKITHTFHGIPNPIPEGYAVKEVGGIKCLYNIREEDEFQRLLKRLNDEMPAGVVLCGSVMCHLNDKVVDYAVKTAHKSLERARKSFPAAK